MGVSFSSQNSDDEEGPQVLSEINITPLTDIFLVLLIIFMVTSSVMSDLGVDVDLPSASSAVSQSQSEGVVVSLLPTGHMKVAGLDVLKEDWSRFSLVLKEAFKKTSSRLVILEGDRQAFLGSAILIMDYAKQAGAEKFAIATTQDGK